MGYIERYMKFVDLDAKDEIVCFQYQCMVRYGGKWHLEKRMVLPGHIFLFESNVMVLKRKWQEDSEINHTVFLTPCEIPYLKKMCQEGNLIGMSRGVIRNGDTFVTSGPLKGRERLIRKIDRHKRTAKIEIPFVGNKKQVTVGLEIYDKKI